MKRVVAIAVIMVVVTSLFSFSVFAASPTYAQRYNDAITKNDVTWSIDALRINTSSLGTSALPGGMETLVYVTAYVSNNNNQAALVSLPKFTLDISEYRIVQHLYSYGGDFSLSQNALSFYLVPNEEFTYANNNGTVIVPPGKTLYFVGAVALAATSNGSSTDAITLNGVHLYDKSNYSVTLGNYSYGDPIDLSSVISYIDNIETYLSTISSSTDQVEAYLLNINNSIASLVNAVTFTGSYSDPATVQYYSTTYDSSPYYLRWIMSPSYITSYDFEIDSSNDNQHAIGTRRYIITGYGYVDNTTAVSATSFYVDLPFNSTLVSRPYVVYTDSNTFSTSFVNGTSILFKNDIPDPRYNNRFLLPQGRTYFVIQLYLDVPYEYVPTWYDVSSLTPIHLTGAQAYTAEEVIYSEMSGIQKIFNKLNDLYKSLVKPANEDNTEEAQEMNDDIHEAEQVWYDNNTEALEQVGLSNYRFSQSQSSGITQAVTQFQAVWNALGSWTNVYIFILILSISTYIIRHEPTTRVKQYRSSVQAERAERISYYGKKNAESRVSSSGSTFKAALRRRK